MHGRTNLRRERTEATATSTSRELLPTLVLGLGTFAVGTDAFIVAGFLPSMAHDLHASQSGAGQSVTVFSLTYALASPIIAAATARVPRRVLLIAGLLVLCVANLGSALSQDLAMLISTRVVAAIGAASYTPNAGAVSASLVRPEFRARALAVVIGGLTVSTALGVPLGNTVNQYLGWRSALGMVAALCLVCALAVRLTLRPIPGNPAMGLRQRLAVLRRPNVVAVLPLTVLGMTAAYVIYAYTVPVLAAVRISAHTVVWMLVVYGIGAVFGNLFSGWSTDRWGAVPTLSAGYVCMAAALGLLGWMAGAHISAVALVVLLLFVWGASSWCQTPSQQHRLIKAAPQEAPLVVSLNSSGIYLGISLGTLIGGISLRAGEFTMCLIGGALALTALIYLHMSAALTRERRFRES